MKAVAIDARSIFQSRHEITEIKYGSGCLEITSQSLDVTQIVRISFLEVAGFRASVGAISIA